MGIFHGSLPGPRTGWGEAGKADKVAQLPGMPQPSPSRPLLLYEQISLCQGQDQNKVAFFPWILVVFFNGHSMVNKCAKGDNHGVYF